MAADTWLGVHGGNGAAAGETSMVTRAAGGRNSASEALHVGGQVAGTRGDSASASEGQALQQLSAGCEEPTQHAAGTAFDKRTNARRKMPRRRAIPRHGP